MSQRSIAALSTVVVGNHWGKAVDKPSQPLRRKAPGMFGDFFTRALALSTMPVDKPADSSVGSYRTACCDGACATLANIWPAKLVDLARRIGICIRDAGWLGRNPIASKNRRRSSPFDKRIASIHKACGQTCGQ